MNTTKIARIAGAVAISACLNAGAATADDNNSATSNAEKITNEAPVSYPAIEAELGLEIGDDYTYRSTDPANELNDLFFTGELAVKFSMAEWLAINLGITAESVLDPQPSTNRAFGDIGLYVEVSVGDFIFVAVSSGRVLALHGT